MLTTAHHLHRPLEGEDKQIMAGFEGEGSGGFLEYVMRRAAKELFDITLDTIELRTLKLVKC